MKRKNVRIVSTAAQNTSLLRRPPGAMLTRAACGPRRAPPAPRALRSVAPRPPSRACIATRATPRSTRPTKTALLTARLLPLPSSRSSIVLCLPSHSARNIASQRSAVPFSLPKILSHNGSASKSASVLDVQDPTVVFPILTALILGAALAMLAQDDEVDAAEQRGRVTASDRASQYAQAGMTIDELREQTSPFFRIAEAPQDLTVLERVNDVFWAAVETMRTFFRFIELSMRFTPLFIASPLLLTPLADYWYKILLHTLRTSGACFIKLGQWAATRKDIFPDDLTTRLSTLHTQAPFHSLEETREMFRRVFGREIEELFDDFNPVPIASGAIAQVYRARLRSGKIDSGDLILKVRHPGVAEGIERDLRILRRSVQIMEVLLGLGWLHPVETVDVFRSNMLAQIDLAVEAANLERFRNNFAGVTTVRFPRPIRMLCRPEVLVETYEEGKLISEFVNNAVDPKLRQNIASLGMDTYLKMMIEDSFTHADLHPGNILVDTRSTPPQIVILDCGLVVKLSQKDRRNFVNLFSTVIEGDSQRAARLMTEDQPHLTPKAIKEFGEAIRVPFEELANKGLAEINVSQVMGGILSAARRTRVRVDPAFTTLVVGTAVLEGLGRQLDPNINLIKHAAPFLRGDPQARRAWVRATLNRGLFTFS